MRLQLSLPAELEERLRREAERQQLPPNAFLNKILDEQLPREPSLSPNPAAALQTLFQQWEEEDKASPDDDPNYNFFEALDAARSSNRKLFPPELKGISW